MSDAQDKSAPHRPRHSHGPWIDIHAHPGACFALKGTLADTDSHLVGGERSVGAIADIRSSEITVSSFATVADLAVIGFVPGGGLGSVREFEPGEALADHDRQLRAIGALAERGLIELVANASDVERLHDGGDVGMLLTCEGGDFVEDDLARLGRARAAGARSVTLVHYRQGDVGDAQTSDPRHGGLSDLGRAIVVEMNRLGMIVDLAHASMAATADALEVSTHPIVISHSHLASPGHDHPRLLTEEHARMVADGGGLVGAWPSGVVCQTLDDYAHEICRLVDLLGVDHVAIGSDMDANYKPVLHAYPQFLELAGLLGHRGLDAAEVDAILGGNYLRVMRSVMG